MAPLPENHRAIYGTRSPALTGGAFIYGAEVSRRQAHHGAQVRSSGTRSGAPEEEDYNDDHQHQAEASAIVMVRCANIEAASAEKEYQDNQKDN
jgi:hypothetical protein